MFKIIYDPQHGQIVPDADIESFVESYVVNHSQNAKITVGSELLVLAFRAEIAEGNLDPAGVEFWYNGHIVGHQQTGSFVNPPKGFCDMHIKLVSRLTKCRRKTMRILKPAEN